MVNAGKEKLLSGNLGIHKMHPAPQQKATLSLLSTVPKAFPTVPASSL
jgi:hypothetical protein